MRDIEKAAKLMGLGVIEGIAPMPTPDGQWREFNPRTNKADLVDVEIELGIDFSSYGIGVSATAMPPRVLGETFISQYGRQISASCNYADHPTKFAARAEAVLSVVSQLYDAKYGKDGE